MYFCVRDVIRKFVLQHQKSNICHKRFVREKKSCNIWQMEYHILIHFSPPPLLPQQFSRNIFNFLNKTSTRFFSIFPISFQCTGNLKLHICTNIYGCFVSVGYAIVLCLPVQCDGCRSSRTISSFLLFFFISFEKIENAEFGHRVMCLK